MKNIITFDLENWYDSEFIVEKKGKDFVLEGLERVLKILEANKVKATFFVTGEVLEKYPQKIKNLSDKGHEIASHSYTHKMLNRMSKNEIIKDIRRSKKLIKKITGKDPFGFRAPSWSMTRKNFWIYEFLEKEGFTYSSSLFPINMGLYGDNSFPTQFFKPVEDRLFYEIPLTMYRKAGSRIPFSGGIYFRLIPKKIIKYFVQSMNARGEFVFLYIHPWELCPEIPRVKTSVVGKITTYWGLKTTSSKLNYLLSNFKFAPMAETIKSFKEVKR